MMALSIRRAGPSLPALLCISACLIPLWIVTGVSHLSHWLGGEDPAAWTRVMAPGASLLWSAAMTLVLGIWAAHFSSVEESVGRHTASFLVASVIVTLGCVFASLPGWRWLSEMGQLSVLSVSRTIGLSLLAPLSALIVAGVLNRWTDRRLALLLAWVSGGAVWWLSLGMLSP